MLPIPSNRTTIQAVDITLQKGDNVFSALKDIIKAQKNRPSIEENADLREIETYAKNYKEWKLAGLQGSVENMTEKEALEKVKEHVQEQVTKLLPLYAQSEWGKFAPIRIPEEDLTFVANKINAGSIPKAISAETATDEERQAYLDAKKDVIEKILTNFYYNFIINQYSVSQMLYGDETFYTSKEDQTKRLQLATATGDTILTDVNYGIPPQSKVLIVEDLRKTVPSNLQGAVAASFRESLDASDAEGFMLPEFYEKIARTYGIEAVTDIVMKPVYYANENGIPVGIKYSVKVLTDELVKEFPHLKSYREEMRRVGADQMTFKSAMKIGRMKTMGKLDDNGNLPFRSTTEDSLVTLNSEYLRFQLNPSHSTDVDVANPSQLTAQINTNGQNTAESLELHNLSAVIIDNGLKDVTRKLRLTRKGGASPASIEILRKMLLSTLEGISGNDDIVEMLKAIEEQTGKSASLSLPLIADRVVSSIASLISKATVGFRFPGSKLVLQADLGKQKVFDVKSGTYQVRDLQFRDHEGYCEIILPEAYREFLETGDLIHKGLKNGLMGFRIPSTNYHSALPLRVVGFYPAPKGSNANIVIAPSLLVYFHGSDYDVDSLFVIKKSKFTGKDVDLNEIISKYDLEHTYDEALYLEKNISVPGFLENGERSKIGGDLYTHQYLEGVLNKINQQVDAISTKLANKNKTREETKQ